MKVAAENIEQFWLNVRSSVAELVVHQDIDHLDLTARLLGGRASNHDSELFDNHRWLETKCAWHQDVGTLGYSPVNWGRQQVYECRIDIVAVVEIRPEHMGAAAEWFARLSSIDVTALDVRRWYVPASVLERESVKVSGARADVPYSVVEPYQATDVEPLTLPRLEELCRLSDLHLPDGVQRATGVREDAEARG